MFKKSFYGPTKKVKLNMILCVMIKRMEVWRVLILYIKLML